jgi:hypothetical protein
MAGSREPISVGVVRCIQESSKAIRVVGIEGEGPVWIPQSCVHDNSEVWKRGQEGNLVVVEWFAEEKGWV